MEEHRKNKKGSGFILGLALGIPLGIPIGLAMNNMAVGPAIGLALGAGLGLALESAKRSSEEIQTPEIYQKQKKLKAGLIILAIVIFFALLVLYVVLKQT